MPAGESCALPFSSCQLMMQSSARIKTALLKYDVYREHHKHSLEEPKHAPSIARIKRSALLFEEYP